MQTIFFPVVGIKYKTHFKQALIFHQRHYRLQKECRVTSECKHDYTIRAVCQ